MDPQSHSTGPKGKALLDAIEAAARKAFGPQSISGSEDQQELDELIAKTSTLSLISALNMLIRPDKVPPWLRSHLIGILARLPRRPDGVRATLEFVFATHPTSTVRTSEAAEPHKQGANITMEAVKMATQLVAAPPSGVSPDRWYASIAPQLFELLDGSEGPDLVKVAAYIIGHGVLSRKQFGAPGTSGWEAFAEPMLTPINPSLSANKSIEEEVQRRRTQAGPDAGYIGWTWMTIVEPDELAKALQRLLSLLSSHPNAGLTSRLLKGLLLPLWSLWSWPHTNDRSRQRFCTPAKSLLEMYLKLCDSTEKYIDLIENPFFDGEQDSETTRWCFGYVHPVGDIRVRRTDELSISDAVGQEDWEQKATAVVELLQAAASDGRISDVFLTLLRRSLRSTGTKHEIKLFAENNEADWNWDDAMYMSQVLRVMLKNIPEKLITDPKAMLSLVSQVLEDDSDSVEIALSMLNAVITAPGFQKSKVDSGIRDSIERSLEKLRKARGPGPSQQAHDLYLQWRDWDAMNDSSNPMSAPTDRQVEDRRTYNLAISYITDAESPPPVRSEGLNLISNLIKANSPILDTQGVLVLLSSLLSDEESYINLRVMKTLVQLSERHPKPVIDELLEHYVDANEDLNVDTRLRFGEAILQVVQRMGSLFTQEVAQKVGGSLLSVAGRRGYRPKTEAKQKREESLRERKKKEADDAWGGKAPGLGDVADNDEETSEQKSRNEVIAQILQGWESKRGAEDVRMRASALSIFSVCVETNGQGLGATIIEGAIELCVSILAMEQEIEKGILRRAAIILILDVVKALTEAREQHRSLGFGLLDSTREDVMRILSYVAETDSDGLVQQHARDVLESLENWRMMTLLPEVRGDDSGLTRIAGLNLERDRPSLPHLDIEGETKGRPKIEEVE